MTKRPPWPCGAEARKLAHEQDEAAKEIDRQYIWVVRPEYQFSQLDFRVDDILGHYRPAKWRDSTVAPFSLGTFLAIEAGDAGRDLTKRLMEELGSNDFSDLQNVLSDGEFSQEQIEEFRVLIGDQIDELLGPLEYLFFEIRFISRAENAAADWVLGEEVEALQEWVADVSLPTWLMENLCEVQ